MTVFGEYISGETPIKDTSGLLLKGITTQRELNNAEAENVRRAVVKYLASKPSRRIAPFDFDWLFAIHREMLGQVWEWAGRARQENLNIGVEWHQVESQIMNLVEDLKYLEADCKDIVEQAAWLHHRGVQLHPFKDGNGRWARMIANIWLKQHDHQPTHWPDKAMSGTISQIREEYLQAVKEADLGNLQPLIVSRGASKPASAG